MSGKYIFRVETDEKDTIQWTGLEFAISLLPTLKTLSMACHSPIEYRFS